jgi:hypothetical protein
MEPIEIKRRTIILITVGLVVIMIGVIIVAMGANKN